MVYMKKIIENVISFPNGAETSRFFGAVSSMHMAVRKNEPAVQEHEFIYHVLYSVSGAGLFRLHQSVVPHSIQAYGADIQEGFILDYVSYTLQYLGYDFKKLSKGETSKEIIWNEVAASIEKNIPVLFKVSGTIQWNLVCGYDENMVAYGLDAKDHYTSKHIHNLVKPEGYLDNGYFYDSKWYDSLEYVLICNQSTKTITFKSALIRMCSIIENHLVNGLNAHILCLKNDDVYFANKTDDYLMNLYGYIDSILGYLMECSHHVSEAFGAVWKKHVDNPNVNPKLQDVFSTLDGVISNTQGTIHKHWGYKPESGIAKYMLLKTKEYRDILLSYFYSIVEDDQNALNLIRQSIDLIDDGYFDTSV